MKGNIRSTWFEQRSMIYAQLAKGLPLEADNVKFRFNPPEAGTIKMYILVENKVNMLIPLSVHNFSFAMLRTFLENIVEHALCVESGVYMKTGMNKITDVFHYEHFDYKNFALLCPMELGEDYPDFDNYGLFCVYNRIYNEPVYALCKTRDFVKSLYLSALSYIGLGDNPFDEEWHQYDGENDKGKWELYNDLKSNLIEWYIYTNKPYRGISCSVLGKKRAIDEIIVMHPGCFMDDEGTECGDCECLSINDTEIEFNAVTSNLLYDWGADMYDVVEFDGKYTDEMYQKGWHLAGRIRKLLPENVDLYFTSWDPYHPDKYVGCEEGYPKLVVPIK